MAKKKLTGAAKQARIVKLRAEITFHRERRQQNLYGLRLARAAIRCREKELDRLGVQS